MVMKRPMRQPNMNRDMDINLMGIGGQFEVNEQLGAINTGTKNIGTMNISSRDPGTSTIGTSTAGMSTIGTSTTGTSTTGTSTTGTSTTCTSAAHHHTEASNTNTTKSFSTHPCTSQTTGITQKGELGSALRQKSERSWPAGAMERWYKERPHQQPWNGLGTQDGADGK